MLSHTPRLSRITKSQHTCYAAPSHLCAGAPTPVSGGLLLLAGGSGLSVKPPAYDSFRKTRPSFLLFIFQKRTSLHHDLYGRVIAVPLVRPKCHWEREPYLFPYTANTMLDISQMAKNNCLTKFCLMR